MCSYGYVHAGCADFSGELNTTRGGLTTAAAAMVVGLAVLSLMVVVVVVVVESTLAGVEVVVGSVGRGGAGRCRR